MLENVPVPAPSDVWDPAVVGSCEVLQHTPRTVTGEPPSEEILPPAVAEFLVIFDAETVVRRAVTDEVVNTFSPP